MTMRKQVHIQEEDLIQYALGNLPDYRLFQMTAHISMCAECRGEVNRIRVALGAFGAATETQTTLPSGARERFLNRLRQESVKAEAATVALNVSRPSFLKRFFTWTQSPVPYQVLSGALAAGMVFFAYDDAMHYHAMRQMVPVVARFEAQVARLSDLEQFLQGSNIQEVSLRPKPVNQMTPEGHAFYSPQQGKLVFTASNLAPIPNGKAYELWILPRDGSAPIPAGTFTPGPDGNAAIIYPQIPTGVEASGFGVTLENANGATKPTMPILLSGE